MCLVNIMKLPDNIDEGWAITVIKFVYRYVLKFGVCRAMKTE
jgi:hypothetical protein